MGLPAYGWLMLMHDLGFRPPDSGRGTTPDPIPPVRNPAAMIPAAILSARPLISFSGMTARLPLGLASAGTDGLRGRAVTFLLSPTWAIEEIGEAEIRRLAIAYRAAHPLHRLIFVVNATVNLEALRGVGEAAFFFNKTATTPEWIFRPLPQRSSEFDAIYNAQLVPWKRHELSLAIERCAFLFHRDDSSPHAGIAEDGIIERHRARSGHVFLNTYQPDGQPRRFAPAEVNAALNRACVGLCLSEREGAMFAGTEYLLAGLPVVTTPNTGGRDTYFDPEFCWTVPPDPRAVADAVNTLKTKRIPPDHIRAKTLARIGADRQRFLGFLDGLLDEGGSRRRFSSGPWPLRKPVTMEWLRASDAVNRAVYGYVDAFEPVASPPLLWRLHRQHLLWRKRLGGDAN
jgi:glycosyltransferase involved in cell wall biosynthesis